MKDLLDFICSLHGYLIRTKEIHWSTDSNAEHLLCDSILDDISSLEDEFTETLMGYTEEKFKIGDLKPLLPRAEELKPMLKELIEDVADARTKLNRINIADKEGLSSILDDIVAMAQKYIYRSTQK